MFIEAHDKAGHTIMINIAHVKYCRSSQLKLKGEQIVKTHFYGADDELIGEKRHDHYGDQQEMVSALTTTVVPVSGYSILRIRGEEDGRDEPIVEETSIVAFRVSSDLDTMPVPVVLDDYDIMKSDGRWGIKSPDGRVLEPYRNDYESPEAFLNSYTPTMIEKQLAKKK